MDRPLITIPFDAVKAGSASTHTSFGPARRQSAVDDIVDRMRRDEAAIVSALTADLAALS